VTTAIIVALAIIAVALLSYVIALRGAAPRGGKAAEIDRQEGSSAEAEQAVAEARLAAEKLRKEAQIEAKEIILRARDEFERDAKARRDELASMEQKLVKREEQIEKKFDQVSAREKDLDHKEKNLGKREQDLERNATDTEKNLAESQKKLEKIAAMSADEARQKLVEQVQEQARTEASREVKRIEDETRQEAQRRAKRIVGAAIQRYAGELVSERTVTVVNLPNDDMKGRIIGREGRNIRALESATGCDLIIDDTPEALLVSSFNPVRREVAKLALEKLLQDGRIHPSRIEEVVAKTTDEVEGRVKEAGEQAVFDLGLHRVHPELVKLIGRLKYRQSYGQNVWQHSVEVGFLCGMLAAELGLNVKQARRAGLLHDIGKAVDHESDGSHAQVGAALAKKHGESPKIVHAIAASHEEEKPETVLAHLLLAADQLSTQRPGARKEMYESYIKRMTDMEKVCTSFKGVDRAFAIQAGREVKVMVDNGTVTDEQSVLLAREIARKIEQELSYAGQIKVSVVRETRLVEYAK
jgi:ribonuclease Y